jgi:uncharacterized protein with PQ loop repeat
MVETLGLVSGAVSALSILPQIYKNVRSGSSTDISTSTILCAYVALSLGTVYGFMIDHVAVYVSDLTILGFYVALHGVKIWNDRKNRVLYTPQTPPWPLDHLQEDGHSQVCDNPSQVRPQAQDG